MKACMCQIKKVQKACKSNFCTFRTPFTLRVQKDALRGEESCMSSGPWLEAMKVTMREGSVGTDGTPEKILETLPSEGCERCKSPIDELNLAVEVQTAEKVCGTWGEDERGLIGAGWGPNERSGLVIWANPETGFSYSQEAALVSLFGPRSRKLPNIRDQKAHASWTLEEIRKRNEGESMSLYSFDSPTRPHYGLWEGVST